MLRDWSTFERLDSLYKQARIVKITDKSKYIIFSDLHMGNRRSRDDFLTNSRMFMEVLENYYLPEGFTLVLNGDVEDLQRVSLKKIKTKWKDFYNLIEKFHRQGRLIKIVGNHDIDLTIQKREGVNQNLEEAVRLVYGRDSILVFHGHQASHYRGWVNIAAGLILRFIAHPLWIKNFSLSHDNTRIRKTEQQVYEYSNKKKILTIIGHTHRPLFESMSEIDFLKFKIEYLLREYPRVFEAEKIKIERLIRQYKKEIMNLQKEENLFGKRSSLYNQDIVIPSIFNSGCVVGKKGFTGLEIENGMISLVHWYNSKRKKRKYFSYSSLYPKVLEGTNYYKMILKKDFLEYIFTRIKLLT